MPDWIEASLTKKRLANPKSHSPDPRLFYSGLVICTAGLPEGDKDAIIGGVLAMGGLYSASVSKLVTHIVALSMEHQACDLVKTKGLRCKIVLPHWYEADSIEIRCLSILTNEGLTTVSVLASESTRVHIFCQTQTSCGHRPKTKL